MNRRIIAVVSTAILGACHDGQLSAPRLSETVFHVSEARTGGNPDLFFGTPLASNAQPGDANFDVGGAHTGLVPYVRICETNGAPDASGCVVDVTQQVTGEVAGLAMSLHGEDYRVNWQTRQLSVSKDYRIEIWGISVTNAAERAAADPRWLFGWRDIRNAPSVSACNGTEAFCLVQYGQTLPVRVRIEQFVFCPLTRTCAMQFVRSGSDANLQTQLGGVAPNAQLFLPGQSGTDFALAFEACSAAEDAAVSNTLDIPTYGPCLKTTTSFTGQLAVPAVISICNQLDPSGFGLSDSQLDQLSLHHVSTDLSRAQALPEAWRCGTPTSGVASAASTTLMDLARAWVGRALGWVAPRPLYATAMIDRGGGGESPFVASFFKLALPAKFEYETAGDAQQSGLAGSSHVLRAKVTDLYGAAVRNARVRWQVIAPPSEGATVLGFVPPGPVLTDSSGIAQKTVQLSGSQGYNVFHAFGRGIADDRSAGCTVPPATAGTCNGPRAAYDPFLPLHVPEIDPAGTETLVELPTGTRLPFTVFGCVPGRGSATVDGTFGAGEWACARSYNFNANVSGGTAPATLYVMNDATTLYLAVRIQRGSGDKVNTLQINFDNNNSWSQNGSGAAEAGDDVLSLDGVKGFVDAYLTAKCTNSGQSSCWGTDVSDGGTSDGSGAVNNNGTFTTYEIAHPLNSGDSAHDISLGTGSRVGMFLTLQVGNGAQGNTQWPGFRRYLELTIQ